MMFYVKVHKVTGEVMLAGCDEEVLGKVFCEGDLEIKVNEGFYGGEIVDENQLMKKVKDATIVNFMGDRIVDLALEKGLVAKEGVRIIAGIKHAQIIAVD